MFSTMDAKVTLVVIYLSVLTKIDAVRYLGFGRGKDELTLGTKPE